MSAVHEREKIDNSQSMMPEVPKNMDCKTSAYLVAWINEVLQSSLVKFRWFNKSLTCVLLVAAG